MFSLLFITIAGAFLWRWRGGILNDLTGQANYKILGIPFNDTTVRIIWSVGMTIILYLIHPYLFTPYILLKLLSSVLSMFCGVTVVGWMGANIKPTTWSQALSLSWSGFLRMSFTAILFWSIWPLVAGLLFAPAYYFGNKIPSPKPWMFWGEIICGVVIGLCFYFI